MSTVGLDVSLRRATAPPISTDRSPTVRGAALVVLRVVVAVPFLLCGPLLGLADSPDRYLVVRYDDYGLRGGAYADMTTALESELFAMFGRHQARLVVGVSPFPLADTTAPERNPASTTTVDSWLARADDPRVGLLREYVTRGVVEPALHGYEHRRRSPPGHRPGEFRGQPYSWQYEAIRLGRDALSAATGRPVRVFVPPWNAWDAETMRALNALGFEWCSADFHDSGGPRTNVRPAPQCSSDPAEVLQWMRCSSELPPGSVIVLVTHPFDFEGARGAAYLTSLEDLLSTVDATPEWACVGFSDLLQATPGEWNERYQLAVSWSRTQALAHDAWGPAKFLTTPPPVYRPAPWYRSHAGFWRLAVTATLAASGAAAWLAAYALARAVLRSRRRLLLAALAATLALGFLSAGAGRISQRGYEVRGVRWQAILVAGGLALGWWGACARRRMTHQEKERLSPHGQTTGAPQHAAESA